MLTCQAKKFFPYGFGPGNRVQILDAADSDDDEDEGGTYQVLDCKKQEMKEMIQKCELPIQKFVSCIDCSQSGGGGGGEGDDEGDESKGDDLMI